MSYEAITVERAEGITVVTLNRPQRANTLSSRLVRETRAAVDEIERDAETRVVIFTGAGKNFCGGADLRDEERSPTFLDDLRALLLRIEALPVPTIAAVNGAAMGGGCELAISCDFRVIDERAVIGVPEIKFGAIAFAGGTQRLPRLIGLARAKEMHFFGEPVDAAEAYRIGLANRVAPAGQAVGVATEMARTLALRPQRALSLAKALITLGSQVDLLHGLEIEARLGATLTGGAASMEEDRKKAAELYPVYQRIFSAAVAGGASATPNQEAT